MTVALEVYAVHHVQDRLAARTRAWPAVLFHAEEAAEQLVFTITSIRGLARAVHLVGPTHALERILIEVLQRLRIGLGGGALIGSLQTPKLGAPSCVLRKSLPSSLPLFRLSLSRLRLLRVHLVHLFDCRVEHLAERHCRLVFLPTHLLQLLHQGVATNG